MGFFDSTSTTKVSSETNVQDVSGSVQSVAQQSPISVKVGGKGGRKNVNIKQTDLGAVQSAFNFAGNFAFDALGALGSAFETQADSFQGSLNKLVKNRRLPEENIANSLVIVTGLVVGAVLLFRILGRK